MTRVAVPQSGEEGVGSQPDSAGSDQESEKMFDLPTPPLSLELGKFH